MNLPKNPQLPKPFSAHTAQPAVAQPKKVSVQPQAKPPIAPAAYRPQPAPKILQAKTAAGSQQQSAQTRPQPVAPPAYRPQPGPKVLQAKTAAPRAINQSSNTPAAPQAYRPQPVPRVLQRQMPTGSQPISQKPSQAPKAPPIYRPQPAPRVLQTKQATANQNLARPASQSSHNPPTPAQHARQLAFRGQHAAHSGARASQPAVAQLKASGPRTHAQEVIQPVMAYRVEYPPYKVQYNEQTGKVTGFAGHNDGFGINISFVMPDHSEHFARERKAGQLVGLRLVKFELKDDLYAAIGWKASNKPTKDKVKQKWVEKVEGLKNPSWSDGANLTKFVKQTALAFNDDWLPVLKDGIQGTASIEFYEDDETGLADNDEVYAYLRDEVADGAVVDKNKVESNGYEEFMTVGKAQRLGYIPRQ